MINITVNLQETAIKYLEKKDPILGKVIRKVEAPKWNFNSNYFLALIELIVSQQLSIKAADTIFGRLKALAPSSELTAQDILKLDSESMRNAGLSWSKVSYVKNVAEYSMKNNSVYKKFISMTDDEIVAELTKIKGVGTWTVEMFLIFTMGRPDVFSLGDLGLRKAIERLYGFKNEQITEQINQISNKWKPYRSIAARYLWKSLTL